MRGVRALVTGAAGFVGVNLCRGLAAAGAEVHGVVRPGGSSWRLPALSEAGTIHAVDLADAGAVLELVGRVGPEVLVHAAARSAYDRQAPLGAVVADTVLGLAHVLDAAAEAPLRRLVLLGSSLVYDPEGAPYREDHPLGPVTRRGATKAAASLLALQHARQAGLPLVELRLFSVYGPWEPPHRLVPRAIRAALLGEELPLTQPGLRRDLVYVGDVVEACLAAAAGGAELDGRVVNVGSGREVANEEVVRAVEEATGKPVRVRAGAYPAHGSDRPHWSADVGLARELLGWTARHSLGEGLARTVPWLEERLVPEGEREG